MTARVFGGFAGIGRIALGAMAFAVVVTSMPAAAQDTNRRTLTLLRQETVSERPRPELDPEGIPVDDLGGFVFFPSLVLQEQFVDNIFFVDSNVTGDFITRVSPTVQLNSDWNNHELNFFGEMDMGVHALNPRENFINWQAGLSGRIDISRDTNVYGSFSWADTHESRGSPDDAAGVHPAFYDVWGGNVGVYQQINRMYVDLSAEVQQFIWKNVELDGIPVNINMQDRDRTQYAWNAEVGYEIDPEFTPFLRATYYKTNYRLSLDDAGVDRDSHGFGIVGGTQLNFSGVLFGDVFAGFRHQNFVSPLSNSNSINFGGNLTWLPDTLTTVILSLNHDLQETTVAGNAGFAASRAGLTVDHEFLRNLIFSFAGSFEYDDFKGTGRHDAIFRVGLQARYLMNRNLYLSVAYDMQNRASNAGAQDYLVNTGMVRLELQY